MELFQVLFAIPVALVASVIYCVGAAFVFSRFEKTRRPAFLGSLVIGAIVLTEVLSVVAFGAKEVYFRFGLGFWMIYVISFSLGPPALANLLLFGAPKSGAIRTIQVGVVIVICWISCVGAVLADILLYEAIFLDR